MLSGSVAPAIKEMQVWDLWLILGHDSVLLLEIEEVSPTLRGAVLIYFSSCQTYSKCQTNYTPGISLNSAIILLNTSYYCHNCHEVIKNIQWNGKFQPAHTKFPCPNKRSYYCLVVVLFPFSGGAERSFRLTWRRVAAWKPTLLIPTILWRPRPGRLTSTCPCMRWI